jgi:hypothetical protein
MNPSPLPQEQSAAVPPPLPSAGQKSHVLRNVLVGAVVLVGLVLGGLVASCPDEAQLRSALYGELGPKYKTILENAGVWARALHLPHLMYHKFTPRWDGHRQELKRGWRPEWPGVSS